MFETTAPAAPARSGLNSVLSSKTLRGRIPAVTAKFAGDLMPIGV